MNEINGLKKYGLVDNEYLNKNESIVSIHYLFSNKWHMHEAAFYIWIRFIYGI